MTTEIQIIVCGWYYSQPTLIESLIELQKENNNVNIFWSCHKEPPQEIKDNFDYKIFLNVGLHMGAYQQALNHLKLEDDVVCFFMHDDVILKNTAFINLCLIQLKSKKFIGASFLYPDKIYPAGWIDRSLHLYDLANNDNRYIFDDDLPIVCLRIRSSFMCTVYSHLKNMGEFDTGEEYIIGEDTLLCNDLDNLLMYKINRIYGGNSIGYLSTKQLDSPFMYELDENKINPKIKYEK